MRTRLPRCRRPSCRLVAAAVAVAGLVGYCYFYNSSIPLQQTAGGLNNYMEKENSDVTIATAREEPGAPVMINQEPGQCPALQESHADIDTAELFPSFDFQPNWIKSKEFWDKSFEDRYEKLRKDTSRPSLKVFVVPHSHNDPGWLKTFEQYFEYQTKNILNNMVQKLNEYPNMTFIWTEISFLNAWWERSHPLKQKALKKLVKQGRVEITSGGWVMPDEACTHIYALIDQFIEGHHWVKTNLGVSPKTGWSVDPFGHGATVPYLLDQSGLEGAIIQRIHFIWKQWLAKRQTEEFYWLPGWDAKKPSLVVHNQPFDIYSIKSTCGPHPSICAHYDFKAMEYYEYSVRQTLVTEQSLPKKANTLLEEYERIGSLTPHNVVLVPLGDDFRYDYPNEFDSQYTNYMKMFNYINSNKKLYNAEVKFGTPLDYFNAVKERHKSIPTLKGDFFVYSDIFTDGVPAYWSGYYTTRPYLKIVARQLEHHLRTAEIIFTLVSNSLGQSTKAKLSASEKKLVQSYEHLIMARRNLGLFQHHDAITGTAKARVMFDYGTKLLTSLYHCMRLQEAALSMALAPALAAPESPKTPPASVLQSEADWDTYGKPAKKLQLSLADKNKVVLFNPLTVTRLEVITLQSNTSNVRVYDTYNKQHVQVQVNPSITATEAGRRYLCNDHFDILFVATVPPLTAIVYHLESHEDLAARAIVFCMNCNDPAAAKQHFKIKKMMPGNIQLENNALKLLINRNTGFLRQVYRKDVMKKTTVDLQFGAYQSAQRHSGAYLFMPDYDNPEKQVLNAYSNFRNLEDDNLLIVSGPVSTEVVVMYLPFLVHRIRIYNVDDYALSRGILIENDINFEPPPKNRDTEFYMRFNTDIQNKDVPEFFTDQNGFQYQKRRKVMALGIEANYYPITTMAWIQDESTRVSVLTAHAQGASSFEPGRLELMLERRTLYDDLRGVGEGVVDNKPACFRHWLLIESLDPADPADPADPVAQPYQLPSPTAEFLSRSFNYPTLVYYVDSAELGKIQLKPHHKFVQNFPDGIHLVTLRTITDDAIDQYPSSSCYMVLQRPGHSCTIPGNHTKTHSQFAINTKFTNLRIHNITSVSLTGLKSYAKLSDLTEVHLDPMEIKTYKLGF